MAKLSLTKKELTVLLAMLRGDDSIHSVQNAEIRNRLQSRVGLLLQRPKSKSAKPLSKKEMQKLIASVMPKNNVHNKTEFLAGVRDGINAQLGH